MYPLMAEDEPEGPAYSEEDPDQTYQYPRSYGPYSSYHLYTPPIPVWFASSFDSSASQSGGWHGLLASSLIDSDSWVGPWSPIMPWWPPQTIAPMSIRAIITRSAEHTSELQSRLQR